MPPWWDAAASRTVAPHSVARLNRMANPRNLVVVHQFGAWKRTARSWSDRRAFGRQRPTGGPESAPLGRYQPDASRGRCDMHPAPHNTVGPERRVHGVGRFASA